MPDRVGQVWRGHDGSIVLVVETFRASEAHVCHVLVDLLSGRPIAGSFAENGRDQWDLNGWRSRVV